MMGLIVATVMTSTGVTQGAGADAWTPAASTAAAQAVNASGGTALSCAVINDAPAALTIAFQPVPLIDLDTLRGFTLALRHRDGSGIATTLDRAQLRVGGSVLSIDKAASQAVPSAYAETTLGGAADLWSLSVTNAQLNTSVELLLEYAAAGLPTIDLDRVTLTMHRQSRLAVIDQRLVARTVVAHLLSDAGTGFLRVLAPGEEPQPEWDAGTDLPWAQVVRVNLDHHPASRSGTESPDVRGLTVVISVGVPDSLTRGDFYALESAMGRVRRALDAHGLSDAGGTHQVWIDEIRAEPDAQDPDARARTGVVTATGIVVRATGRLFEGES